MKKRVLSILLCLCMVSVLLPTTVSAADTVNLVKLTMPQPKVGAAPATVSDMVLPKNASTYVKAVNWDGSFDENGHFQAQNYTLTVTLGIRDGVGRTFKTTKAALLTINGKEATIVSESPEELILSYTFTYKGKNQQTSVKDAMPSYTLAEADSLWYGKQGKTLVLTDENRPKGGSFSFSYLNGTYSDQEMLYFTKAIFDFSPSTSRGSEEQRELAKSFTASGTHVPYLYNLKDLWIGPKMDVVTFMESFEETAGDFQWPGSTAGSAASGFTVYIPEESLSQVRKAIGRDGRLNTNYMIKTYSGDVFAAERSGSAKEICTNHSYTEKIISADRVRHYANCQHAKQYYYSCANCGKCEYNPNHLFSMNPANGKDDSDDRDSHNYEQELMTDAAYIGVDAAGYKVYFKTCSYCQKPYNVLYADGFTRQDFALAFGAKPEITYEQYLASRRNSLEKIKKAALDNSTKFEKPSTFRVENKSVAAKMSVWAQHDVNYANLNGLLDKELLGADYSKAISRLQFCSVAVQLAEKLTGKSIVPAPNGTFTDTQNEYALKAYAAGITSGTTDTAFAPNATLNRQEMATFIYRALQYVKANSDIRYTPYDAKLGSFADAKQLGDWAQEPMAFMNALGLITGTSSSTLSPNNQCTIEQALVVASRSLNAHHIGWYQCIATTEKNSGNALGGSGYKYFKTGVGTYVGFTDYSNIMRVWVTGPRVGGDRLSNSYYPAIEPRSGQIMYIVAEDFRPIRE